jgi:hypothetical protein
MTADLAGLCTNEVVTKPGEAPTSGEPDVGLCPAKPLRACDSWEFVDAIAARL